VVRRGWHIMKVKDVHGVEGASKVTKLVME